MSFYVAAAGEETFRGLIHLFYQGVADDPQLRPVYPGKDPGPGRGAPAALPHPVLGRPGHLRRAAGPPPAADAARQVHDRRGRTGRVAAAHARGPGPVGLDQELDAQLWDYLVWPRTAWSTSTPRAQGRPDLGLSPAGARLLSPA